MRLHHNLDLWSDITITKVTVCLYIKNECTMFGNNKLYWRRTYVVLSWSTLRLESDRDNLWFLLFFSFDLMPNARLNQLLSRIFDNIVAIIGSRAVTIFILLNCYHMLPSATYMYIYRERKQWNSVERF